MRVYVWVRVRVLVCVGSVPSDCLAAAGLGPRMLSYGLDSMSAFLLRVEDPLSDVHDAD